MPIKDQLFLASQYLAPHHLVSRLFGYASDCREPAVKNWMISRFVQRYGVDMSEAEQEDALAYDCFNDFFTRALKDGARPLDDEPGSVLCPADGAISQMGAIEHGRIFQAKGHSYGLADLLGGDAERAAPFQGGEFATIYLSPRDYHRVTCRWPARCAKWSTCRRLFSVNPLTARNVPRLFARNERVVCIFDTEHGPMALVLVGAMIVASIETVWAGRSRRTSAASRPRATTPTRAHPSTGQGRRDGPLQARVHRHRAVRPGQDPLVRHALGARPGPHGRAAGPAGLRPPARSGGQP